MELKKIPPVEAVHLEGIRLAEILLREERKLCEIIKRLQVLRICEAALLQTVTVEFVLPYAAKTLLQALELHFRVFVAAHGLSRAIPKYILRFHALNYSTINRFQFIAGLDK